MNYYFYIKCNDKKLIFIVKIIIFLNFSKLYDKSVKTYVYSLCGKPFSKIQLPKDNKTGFYQTYK